MKATNVYGQNLSDDIRAETVGVEFHVVNILG